LKCTVKPASREEALWVSSRLRPADRREVETLTGRHPEEVLKTAYELSAECYVLRFNDEPDPVAVFGVTPGYAMMGVPWFLATPQVVRGSKAILREAPKWLNAWSQKYFKLYNIVDPRNELHVRWVVAAGCRLSGSTVEINGHPFIPFFYN